MLDKLKTLSEVKERIPPSGSTDTLHLGDLTIGEHTKDDDVYKIMEYMFDNVLPPLKIFKWGDLLEQRKNKKFTGFNGLKDKAVAYHSFLHHGVTNTKLKDGHAGFGFENTAGEEEHILTHGSNVNPADMGESRAKESVGSVYYHSSKAHWLIQSIQKEGLWAPIQGFTRTVGDTLGLTIHPGSVRSGCFEEMENEDMELMIWDCEGVLDTLPSATLDETLEYWKGKLDHKMRHLNIAFLYTRGVIEWQSDLAELGFRKDVGVFNRTVHELAKGKPLTIYIGYDSKMNDLEEISKFSIEKTIKDAHTSGTFGEYIKFMPEIKFLDYDKIPEYNREYANQSTAFTYSRFLIPYLENYEGFSLFVDNDFIFTKNLLTMFYYLNPEDAVACIKYPHYDHDVTKFDGEINIDYPCKLWSSMMFFNNGHEDCKKLTPEVVNTWTGKQLHQFEWTDAISEIPQKYIFVEGYDNPEEKWDYTGIHYTRGGPWIDGMNSDSINNLEVYNKYKNLYENQPK